jgi:hypothetical protein
MNKMKNKILLSLGRYIYYIRKEENAAAINYLKNRPAAMEEPFTEVVSKAKKKNSHKGVNVHNTRARGKNRL